jgi:hypothetical protein
VASLLKKQSFRLGAGGLLMAIVGAVLTLAATGAFASSSAVADRISLYYSARQQDDLPLTPNAAEVAGWTAASGACSVGADTIRSPRGPTARTR